MQFIKSLCANIAQPLIGIDIGCGASCIYPLLGSQIIPLSSYIALGITDNEI